MKLRKLNKHLRQHRCDVAREGGSHTIWIHRDNGREQPVPRHTEVSFILVRKICRELDIPTPEGER